MLHPATEIEYVGFWPRLGATLIDTVLLLLITTPLMLAVYGRYYWAEDVWIHGPAHVLISYVLPTVLQLALWIWLATTPGKMAVKAVIVDAHTGGKPSAGQFVIRSLASYLSALPLFLGFIWIGLDTRKQGWHDKLAGTVVIRRHARQAVA